MAKATWNQPDWVRVYRGFDMGWWPDPAYCVWVAVIGRRIIAFKEKSWFKTIAKDIAREIVAESEGMKVVTTYCDPKIQVKDGNVESIFNIMEKERMPMDPATNSRELYAHSINSALKEEAMPGASAANLRAGCPYLAKSLPQMRFDDKNPMAMADHKHDHPAVALAYILMNVMPNTAPRDEVSRPKWWSEYFVGNSNVPQKQATPRRRKY